MSNILIVDDEQSYRQLLTLVFEPTAIRSRTANNGREAPLKCLSDDLPTLIISDVKMPDMDGIELLARCANFCPTSAMVMMTAFASVETAREAFKLGADDFIQKPFDVEELETDRQKSARKTGADRRKPRLQTRPARPRKRQKYHRRVGQNAGDLSNDRNGRRSSVNDPDHGRERNG
jgi:DNA-binding NtrC family response regulator